MSTQAMLQFTVLLLLVALSPSETCDGVRGFPGRPGIPGAHGADGKDGPKGEKGDRGRDNIFSCLKITHIHLRKLLKYPACGQSC